MANDSNVIGNFYDSHSDLFYGLVLRIVGSESEAETVLCDAFDKLKDELISTDALDDRQLFKFIMLCRKLALEKRLATKAEVAGNFPGQDIKKNIAEDFSGKLNRDGKMISGKLNALETDYKRIIELLFLEGKSQAETAESLHIPLGTVKSRSRAALHQIQVLHSKV